MIKHYAIFFNPSFSKMKIENAIIKIQRSYPGEFTGIKIEDSTGCEYDEECYALYFDVNEITFNECFNVNSDRYNCYESVDGKHYTPLRDVTTDD